jgi:hypothetical protein
MVRCLHFVRIIANQYQTEKEDWTPVMQHQEVCDTDQVIPACQWLTAISTIKYTYNDNLRVYLHVP